MAEGETALIVGVGTGLSASLTRLCAGDRMKVAISARDTAKLEGLAAETGAKAYRCDVTQQAEVEDLLGSVSGDLGDPDLVVFNPSYRTRGPLIELDPDEVEKAVRTTCLGGFLVAQAAAKRMLARGSGSILFTGASASVKGYPESAPFAMGKFGLRGLVQSIARELAPKNIHIAHFIIDGGIAKGPEDDSRGPDGKLQPDAIAKAYFDVYHQHRSAWTWEVELRPWVEKF